jgi:cytidylate kinase
LRCIQTNVIYKDVLDDLIRRDNQDYYRTVSPLMDSENTVTIDSSYLNAKQVFQKAIFFVKNKIVNT